MSTNITINEYNRIVVSHMKNHNKYNAQTNKTMIY